MGTGTPIMLVCGLPPPLPPAPAPGPAPAPVPAPALTPVILTSRGLQILVSWLSSGWHTVQPSLGLLAVGDLNSALEQFSFLLLAHISETRARPFVVAGPRVPDDRSIPTTIEHGSYTSECAETVLPPLTKQGPVRCGMPLRRGGYLPADDAFLSNKATFAHEPVFSTTLHHPCLGPCTTLYDLIRSALKRGGPPPPPPHKTPPEGGEGKRRLL